MLPDLDTKNLHKDYRPGTPERILQQAREHRQIAHEAISKIDAEGTVVRTLKGDVIAHPAIRIHADAVKAEEALLKMWGKR